MMTVPTCFYCHQAFMDNDRVVFSHRETFIFKPADVQDLAVLIPGPKGPREVSAAAVLSPTALAESRKDYVRTAIANTFGDWGKMQVPDGAYNFRHQWCEPFRTGSGALQVHASNKHNIRFGRSMPRRLYGESS